ncbi:MAG: DUF1998 domain-containing protein, partial [Sandaracinaceae bacterium]|nr:DUF1998 domain-containing protein [Sandaracinaceae bacterium]
IWLSCLKHELNPAINESLLDLRDETLPLTPDLKEAIKSPDLREEARKLIVQVLELVESELKGASWYSDKEDYAEDYAKQIVDSAPERFDQAFERWRELYRAAVSQRDMARKIIDTSDKKEERESAKIREKQAQDQLDLLKGGADIMHSDFYVYRYLATEGFLPGYNFPRLPLLAYIPESKSGKGGKLYLKRPRFLGLTEFGPGNLIYHEGQVYRVNRLTLVPQIGLGVKSAGFSGNSSDTLRYLPTTSIRICRNCGAACFDESISNCHSCGASLANAENIIHAYRISTVSTHPVERITSNQEERKRTTFRTQIAFTWAVRNNRLDVQRATVGDTGGKIAEITYGSSASIIRINKGYVRRKKGEGDCFWVDPLRGDFLKKPSNSSSSNHKGYPGQPIVPYVQDHKNALLFRLLVSSSIENEKEALITLPHALLRGIEASFELEQGEVQVAPILSRPNIALLFYEAADGGAGVLAQLIQHKELMATIAKKALEIMHFDVSDRFPSSVDELKQRDLGSAFCERACYKCLLSYYNQSEHEDINRSSPSLLELLFRLAYSLTFSGEEEAKEMSNLASIVMDRAHKAGVDLPKPDPTPLLLSTGLSLECVWRSHFVVLHIGEVDPSSKKELKEKGYEVVQATSMDPAELDRLIPTLCEFLGVGK